jgi:chemotaxis protein MotB
MKKISLILISVMFVSSCVSKKDFAALQSEKTKTQAQLITVKGNLQKCLIEQDEKVFALTEQIKYLQADKKNALKQVENLTILTQSSSDNIKKSNRRYPRQRY